MSPESLLPPIVGYILLSNAIAALYIAVIAYRTGAAYGVLMACNLFSAINVFVVADMVGDAAVSSICEKLYGVGLRDVSAMSTAGRALALAVGGYFVDLVVSVGIRHLRDKRHASSNPDIPVADSMDDEAAAIWQHSNVLRFSQRNEGSAGTDPL